MSILVFVLIILLVLFGVASAAIVLRRPAPAPPTSDEPASAAAEIRAERRRAAQALGTELLERRVDLDARRGTLQGDASIADELERLENRVKAGEISEETFEAEKVRILGG